MTNVGRYLAERDIDFAVFGHRRTYTSLAQAHALGVAASNVAKTVVLDTPEGHALAVLPASEQLDFDRLRAAVGSPVWLAGEHEIGEDFPTFEPGAIPPIGPLVRTPIYFDSALAWHEDVIFATSQTESVSIHTAELLADPAVTIAPLTTSPAEGRSP